MNIDFTDLPHYSAEKQVVSIEQLAIMCGLNRRVSRRLGKTVSIILSNYPPETLIENSVRLKPVPAGHSLELQFATHPLNLADASQASMARLGSLRRVGEKFPDFELSGSPNEGFEIRFSELLPIGFELPRPREFKQWERVVATGDWERGFASVSKIYLNDRQKLQAARDGISIRPEELGVSKNETDVILSLVASKADNPVLILNSHGEAEWANRAVSTLLGIELVNPEVAPAADLLFGSSPSRAKTEFEKNLVLKRTFSLEYSWTPPEELPAAEQPPGPSTPIWIEFQVTPVRDESGGIVRWIAIGADITRRRQAELAMQAAKEVAESASKAKSDFLAMMSHEIRTPMNAIIGMTELTLGTRLTIDQREYLTTANNSAQALLQILNDILDLSKVEAQRMDLEAIDFNIADITRETLDTLSVLAQRKDLSLCCNFPLDIHQQLIGDPTRLRQILVNLVGNAIKFTSIGGVAVRVELLDETNDSVSLHYQIQDTGVGISADKTSRIFEAFFQTDASVNRSFGGTGLGLAITSELIRLMGGRIWVESKLGNGSTFHFVLTFKKSSRTFVSIPIHLDRELQGKRILVVDDNDSNRLAIGRWMKAWGANCQFATTGKEGSAMLAEHPNEFDLAILDVILPDIDGFEIARKVANADGSTAIPILMFSSDDRTSTITRCREHGIGCYLIKPVSPKTLFASIQIALGASQRAETKQLGSQASALLPTHKSLNVLVVDDHTSNRKLIGEILRRRGHRWQECSNGRQAVDAVNEDNFDVILMDLQMPGMDGLEATAAIRALSTTAANTSIVAVTAYVTEDDRQRCLDASMDDYLAKPISVDELLEKVERWGNTTRQSREIEDDGTLDNQLLIQDAPEWATQITRTIVVAEDGNADVKPASASTVAEEDDSGPAFSKALARFGGDHALLQMQIGIFLEEVPDLLQNLHQAVRESDSKSLHHNAHRLKGLVQTYDDELAGELAGRIEEIGANGTLEESESTLALAEPTLSLLTAQIDTLSERLRKAT